MALNPPSPAPSTLFLPSVHRNTVTSSSPSTPTVVDRETLCRRLDQIHSAASQTSALTTFSEYATPDSAVSTESLPVSDSVQSSVSGIFNKFKDALGGSRERLEEGAAAPSPHRGLSGSQHTPSRPHIVTSSTAYLSSNKPSRLSVTTEALPSTAPPEIQDFGANSRFSGRSSHPGVSSVDSNEEAVSPGTQTPADGAGKSSEIASPSLHRSQRTEDGQKVGTARPSRSVQSLSKDHVAAIAHQIAAASNARQLPGSGTENQPAFELENGEDKTRSADRPGVSRVAPGTDGTSEPILIVTNDTGAVLPISKTGPSHPDGQRQQGRGSTVDGPTGPNNDQARLPGFSLSRSSSFDTVSTGLPNPASSQSPTRSSSKARSTDQITTGVTTKESRQASHTSFSKETGLLPRKYWMKDEVCKECFLCGDVFTTFRRKHHCRVCGQIFDSKCTTLTSGDRFGQPGSIKVCTSCLRAITAHDENSDYGSDLEDVPEQNEADGPVSSQLTDQPRPLSSPMMAIPARRHGNIHAHRNSAVLEIDGLGGNDSPRRPTSSWSTRPTNFTLKPPTLSHRRFPSRQLTQRTRTPINERAPFHRANNDDHRETRLPAFHNDSIVDPDLDAYLSDELSSDDEQMSLFATLSGDVSQPGVDMGDRIGSDRPNLSNRRPRSRFGPQSINVGADDDTHSLRSVHYNRYHRKPHFGSSGNLHRLSMQTARRDSSSTIGDSPLHPRLGDAVDSNEVPDTAALRGFRMTRSASMTGDSAPPIELNAASLSHCRRLLGQLLADDEVPNPSSWQRYLIPILLRCTDDVNPDIRAGDDLDIRHYVKMKRIPGGKPGDSSYVSGVVFTKNMALKSMPRSFSHPKIMIIAFPLEYARRNHRLMSLEPVLRQEKEYLRNIVNRIVALRPDLLLVQKSVSGRALQYLDDANIATVSNLKQSVIEAVARCTQADVVTSMESLNLKRVRLGRCAAVELKTYLHPGVRGGKKTYFFISGCARDLGCTVILRGAPMDVLAKIKRLTEFMIYVVNNLKLETCLMQDENIFIAPGEIKSPLPVAVSEARRSSAQSQQSEVKVTPIQLAHSPAELRPTILGSTSSDSVEPVEPQSMEPAGDRPGGTPDVSADDLPDDTPMPTFYTDVAEKYQTKILSASPFVKFMQPYLLMRAREQERRLAHLRRLRDQDLSASERSEEKTKPQKFQLITPEMLYDEKTNAPKKIAEVLHAIHDAEHDKALYNYQTQARGWETYITGNSNLFDPLAHQNIAVLYSLICTATTVPCSGPDILTLGFYDQHAKTEAQDPDCCLGQYVEDLCRGASSRCSSCTRKMSEHHRCYVHGEAKLDVHVEKLPSKLPELRDTILMWSYCKICQKEMPVHQMSETTWKYSFGKYLELSFWSKNLRAESSECQHDVHRDHIRYMSLNDTALRIHYDPVGLLEIVVPRTRITWKVENDLRMKVEAFKLKETSLNKYMLSVKNRIRGLNTESVIPEKIDECRAQIDQLQQKAAKDHEHLLAKLQKRYMNSKYWEIIPLNRATRAVQIKVGEWDAAFAKFDKNYFPSERDIRRLAALQMKKLFLDREDTISLGSSSLTSPQNEEAEVTTGEKAQVLQPPTTADLRSEHTQDILHSVMPGDDVSEKQTTHEQESKPGLMRSVVRSEVDSRDGVPPDNPIQSVAVEKETIRHLDLAVSKAGGDTGTKLITAVPLSGIPVREEIDAHIPPANSGASLVGPEEAKQHLPINSAIPRPTLASTRPAQPILSPSLLRTRSQPNPVPGLNDLDPVSKSPEESKKFGETIATNLTDSVAGVERFFTDKFAIQVQTLRQLSGSYGRSKIPRSIPHARRADSARVSTLAKHFEQLSREFEKERLRERRQRAESIQRARRYPMVASRPRVEVYKDARDAVAEHDPSEVTNSTQSPENSDSPIETMQHSESTAPTSFSDLSENTAEDQAAGSIADPADTEDSAVPTSQMPSDAEDDDSDEDGDIEDDVVIPEDPSEPSETSLPDLKLDLPRQTKSNIMKLLTNFWAERSASGWTALEYPLSAGDHLFVDSDMIVREDEPSSLIAWALSSEDYKMKLAASSVTASSVGDRRTPSQEEPNPINESVEASQSVEDILVQPVGTHLKYQVQDGAAKMECKIFYAEQFDALRQKCGCAERIVESLSRCGKWAAKGGKTRAVFLKTLDDRFIIKSLSTVETQAFLLFAPAYFQFMSQMLFHELPSVIAKMLGFYQIVIRNPVTGVDIRWDCLVMENLFYDRYDSLTRIFDLKGSMRNRKVKEKGEGGEVLLDENMVEYIYEKPLFAREHSKKLLRASVWNDTLFLARQNVMDYSLMVAIDDERKELIVGIVDCIRTYTWDKKLESWIKEKTFMPGGKGAGRQPTVMGPKEYKSRFREAMKRYVLEAPNCWHQSGGLLGGRGWGEGSREGCGEGPSRRETVQEEGEGAGKELVGEEGGC